MAARIKRESGKQAKAVLHAVQEQIMKWRPQRGFSRGNLAVYAGMLWHLEQGRLAAFGHIFVYRRASGTAEPVSVSYCSGKMDRIRWTSAAAEGVR